MCKIWYEMFLSRWSNHGTVGQLSQLNLASFWFAVNVSISVVDPKTRPSVNMLWLTNWFGLFLWVAIRVTIFLTTTTSGYFWLIANPLQLVFWTGFSLIKCHSSLCSYLTIGESSESIYFVKTRTCFKVYRVWLFTK